MVGASADRGKYSNKAVRAYMQKGWEVYPVNPNGGTIEELKVYTLIEDLPIRVDRVTLYVPPTTGVEVLPAVAALEPDEFFVNPGAESDELIERCKALGLKAVLSCSIVDIGVSLPDLPE